MGDKKISRRGGIKEDTPVNWCLVFRQNFVAYGCKFWLKKRKRNNIIDILKAGGTRILLFLQYLK